MEKMLNRTETRRRTESEEYASVCSYIHLHIRKCENTRSETTDEITDGTKRQACMSALELVDCKIGRSLQKNFFGFVIPIDQ